MKVYVLSQSFGTEGMRATLGVYRSLAMAQLAYFALTQDPSTNWDQHSAHGVYWSLGRHCIEEFELQGSE